MPTVSIVIPCYNGAKFVGRTIESIQNQTFTDWEVVVVDDGSTDDSAAVVTAYASRDARVRLHKQPNGHLCNARNNGYKDCSPDSRYLYFLDADDLLTADALEKMTRYLDTHAEVGMVNCTFRCIDANDALLTGEEFAWTTPRRFVPKILDCLGARELPIESGATPLPTLMAYHQAIPSSCLFRRTIFERAGRWDEAFSQARMVGCEDKDMVIRMALEAPVHLMTDTLMLYRRHASNITNAKSPGQEFMESRWKLRLKTMPQETASRVRRAFIFDRYLTVYMMLHAAKEAAKARQLRRSLTFTLGTGQKLAVFFVRGLRWLYAV